jgi:hypothetical protein
MKRLLVIEDGDEYVEFARLFLADDFEIEAAGDAEAALAVLAARGADALLIDLRFERASPSSLVGDLDGTAARLFAGDRERALRYLKDQQGALILGRLRDAGHLQRAVFIHELPPRRLENLRRLYGAVEAVAGFDAAALRVALGAVTRAQAARRLAHDVGKYVARAARNLDGAPDAALLAMLVRDLYGLGGERASTVCARLGAALDGDARAAAAQALLVEADGLEARVRAGEPAAVARAAALALEVERRLRRLAIEIADEEPSE